MAPVSLSDSLCPELPVLLSRSLPARSTSTSLPHLHMCTPSSAADGQGSRTAAGGPAGASATVPPAPLSCLLPRWTWSQTAWRCLFVRPSQRPPGTLLNGRPIKTQPALPSTPAHAAFDAAHQLLPRAAAHLLRADRQGDKAVAAAAVAVELVRARVARRKGVRQHAQGARWRLSCCMGQALGVKRVCPRVKPYLHMWWGRDTSHNWQLSAHTVQESLLQLCLHAAVVCVARPLVGNRRSDRDMPVQQTAAPPRPCTHRQLLVLVVLCQHVCDRLIVHLCAGDGHSALQGVPAGCDAVKQLVHTTDKQTLMLGQLTLWVSRPVLTAAAGGWGVQQCCCPCCGELCRPRVRAAGAAAVLACCCSCRAVFLETLHASHARAEDGVGFPAPCLTKRKDCEADGAGACARRQGVGFLCLLCGAPTMPYNVLLAHKCSPFMDACMSCCPALAAAVLAGAVLTVVFRTHAHPACVCVCVARTCDIEAVQRCINQFRDAAHIKELRLT